MPLLALLRAVYRPRAPLARYGRSPLDGGGAEGAVVRRETGEEEEHDGVVTSQDLADINVSEEGKTIAQCKQFLVLYF